MTDNDNQSKIKMPSNKLWLVYTLLILGIGILAALYINFQLTYKFNGISKKISELDSNQIKITSLSKAYPAQEEAQSTEKKLEEPSQEKNPQLASCLNLNNFLQDFYIIKLNVEKGNDFSIQASELNKYMILSSELKQPIDNLINLSTKNKEINYFKLSFNHLIRDLYKQPSESKFFNLKDYVFVRAIGEKAIKNGGLDRQIALIEQALNNNNLQEVDEYLQELPQDIISLNNFKIDVKNQLSIQESLKQIETILFDKRNDMTVSK